MRHFTQAFLILILSLNVVAQSNIKNTRQKIDRRAVVERHRIVTTSTNPKSPAQVGNGEFAFGVDITGLQTFVPFNTLSHWSWHSFPIPEGQNIEDFKGLTLDTHGRMTKYNIQNDEQPELSSWLAGNPHRFNLGRIGFLLLKSDGTKATMIDLKNTRQEVDLWNGIIYSSFVLEGKLVTVKTACHPFSDALGVSVKSDLIKKGQIKIFLDFPYPDSTNLSNYGQDKYMGNYNKGNAHFTTIDKQTDNSVVIARKMDDTKYFVSLFWTSKAHLIIGDTISSKHRLYLLPDLTDEIAFSCTFSPMKSKQPLLTSSKVFIQSCKAWPEYWKSGAAIDLSQSKDFRWKELERRIVLSPLPYESFQKINFKKCIVYIIN